MKIWIYGTTETAYMAAVHLSPIHDVSVLDERERLPERFDALDINFISGSGADAHLLDQAEASRIDLFIACSRLDEANIVACWTIKRITNVETICFVHKGELFQSLMLYVQSRFRTSYDIDTVIWPEQLLTQDIFRVVSVPEAVDVEFFAQGKVKMFIYRIKEDSIICNQRVMDCDFPPNLLIVGITRENELFIPNGATRIQLNDKVVFMGTGHALDLLTARFFKNRRNLNRVVVIGGGNVGLLLSEHLEQTGLKVTVIERNRKRCDVLADHLRKSLVLHGDGTDIDLLESESVGAADVTICVTDNDEKNLLCSLLVKQIGASRIITRVSNAQTALLFEKVGVDVVISPHEAALKELLNHVQSKDIDILALIGGGQGEIVRLSVPDSFKDTRVADLPLKAKAVIGVVQRGHAIIVPNGNTVIKSGDFLKLFTLATDVKVIQATFEK